MTKHSAWWAVALAAGCLMVWSVHAVSTRECAHVGSQFGMPARIDWPNGCVVQTRAGWISADRIHFVLTVHQ